VDDMSYIDYLQLFRRLFELLDAKTDPNRIRIVVVTAEIEAFAEDLIDAPDVPDLAQLASHAEHTAARMETVAKDLQNLKQQP
jgi:hypothetical protein